jgi:hypothetical protein
MNYTLTGFRRIALTGALRMLDGTDPSFRN